MSELQIALLAIGLGVIFAVYVFSWWQQKQYKRKFGASFKTQDTDPLYQDNDPLEPAAAHAAQDSAMAMPDHDHKSISLDDLPVDKSVFKNEETVATAVETPTMVEEEPQPQPKNVQTPKDPCSLLDKHSDFIIDIKLKKPASSNVMEALWHRKFDFDKPVQMFGLTLAEQQRREKTDVVSTNPVPEKWERIRAENHSLFVRFRVALQMLDRGGVVSLAKLANFRDLVQGIADKADAEIDIPDLHKAHQYAAELDSFCASIDQIIGINLVPPGDRDLSGRKIEQAAALQGMTLEADGAFHLMDENGNSIFSLVNQDNTAFQYHTLDEFYTPAITLLLDVPRTLAPSETFDQMVYVAQTLARDLQVNLVDDHMVVLSEAGLSHIRSQIAEVEKIMSYSKIGPGSAQACRLFV